MHHLVASEPKKYGGVRPDSGKMHTQLTVRVKEQGRVCMCMCMCMCACACA